MAKKVCLLKRRNWLFSLNKRRQNEDWSKLIVAHRVFEQDGCREQFTGMRPALLADK